MSDTPPLAGGPTTLADAIVAAREEIAAARERIGELHRRGLDPLQVCGRLTSMIDGVVAKLFDAAESELDPALISNLRHRIALVGLGSYGRRQLAPYSDVDLMILHDGLNVDQLTPIVRRFTNAMFDAGLQLGHSVRMPLEAVQLARGDAIICSSLIDSRLVVASQPLFESFRGHFERMVRRRAKSLCRAFYKSRADERSQFGETIYLLEPHVKRSRGALRDVHLLRWIGLVEHGESDPDRLHLLGAMSKFEHHRLVQAQTFLLRLRHEMHFNAGTSRDSLERAEQLRVAGVFGYRGTGGLLPVEQFMRDYFHHANHVWQMVQRREASMETASTMARMLNPVLGRNIEGDFRVGVSSISATRTGLSKLQGNLAEVLRIVELSVREGKPLDHATSAALFLAAPDCSEEMMPAVAARFMEILAQPHTAAKGLRTLHELGYLEKIIPAMKHARCLLQFNEYHKYTVDEHSLVAVERVAEFAERDDALGAAYRAVADKSLLHLTLILHDLGKGFEEDHSEVGRRIAHDAAARLTLDDRSAADVEYLVHQHLAMSHLAFRRDTTDVELIGRFAESVQTPDRLRMLFCVSCADLAAVGPDVLTQWKTEVLADLYARTLALVDENPPPAKFEVSERRKEIWSGLTAQERADGWFERQVAKLPPSYLAARPAASVIEALRRFHKLPARGAVAWGEFNREANTVEFTAGVDHGRGRGAFSSMAGALTSHGLEILGADTQIMADDLLLLRYAVLDPDSTGAPEPERLAQIAERLSSSVDSREPPQFRRLWGQEHAVASKQLTAMPNVVRIDNRASADATVVEVFTFDRTGLLYRLARKLHEMELTIWHAKIATYLDQVVDVFYVTNRGGGKIVDDDRLDQIRREMFAAIDEGESGQKAEGSGQ